MITRNLKLPEESLFGSVLVSRFLPVPFMVLVLVIAIQTQRYVVVLSVGFITIIFNITCTFIESNETTFWRNLKSADFIYWARMVVNGTLEAGLILFLGADSMAWVLVLSSTFAAPFAWELRRAILYSGFGYLLSVFALLYVGEAWQVVVLFSGMEAGALFIAYSLMSHFRMCLETIRASAQELLEVEREKSKVAMEAQQYRRLASMGQLAAGIAHEINNPLSYVISNLEYVTRSLASETQVDEDVRTALDDAVEGTERVRYIVRDIKTFSRPDDAKRHHLVDLNDVINSSINIMRNQVDQRAILEVELADIPSVFADKAALGQVFVNLLANAAQAINPDSTVENKICVKTEQIDSTVQVSVTDTGSGIEESIKGKIFDPFFTSKPLGIGTGLGLSIVSQIVAKCNGAITVESKVGEGTTFFIRFPAVSEEEERSATGSYSSDLRTMTRVNRALIIDDDRNLVLGLARQFNKCEVVVATSGAEALEILNHDRTFDIILCDLIMPVMTGVETYEAAVSQWPELQEKFVFMTGGAFTPQVRAFLEQDWVRCLSKPFSWAELLRILMLPGTPEGVEEVAEQRPSSRASSQFSH